MNHFDPTLECATQVADIVYTSIYRVLLFTYDFNSILPFTSSTFTNNTATTDGTVLLIQFGAIFEGTNNFTGNAGGGIVLVLARMDSRGTLWFHGNRAQDGAGVSMQEYCLVSP